jgi:hypothetical protein
MKKRKKTKGKKLEIPKDKNQEVKQAILQADNLAEKIKKAAEGLYYISETDAEIEVFDGKQAEAVTKEEVLSQSGNSSDTPVAEKEFSDFFAPLTEMQDWFGDEEKAAAQKFALLQDLLQRNLRDLKAFKIGKIQLDVYVVGLDADNKLLGIKTKAVET